MKTKVAIAADSPITINAGKQVAYAGGNAVDIAVACALTASISEILMCSLGGSAFINIKMPGKDAELIDGADAMPCIPKSQKAGKEKSWKQIHIPYGDGININVGHASVAVPGMLRALEKAWQRHGKLPWKEICAPALEVAKKEIPATETLAMWLEMAGGPVFYHQQESRKSFFPDGKNALTKDQLYRIPYIDNTIEAIAREGSKVLYEGDIAKAFVDEIKGNGGYVAREDLAGYQAIIRKPLLLETQGFHLALNPPPAIGGAMIGSMIQMYDAISCQDDDEAQRDLKIAKIQRAMFSLREEESGDNWSELRANQILEKEWLLKYLDKVYSPHTMHISVATASGAVTSITMSNGYGSGISIPGTGIPTNNSLGEPELNPSGFMQIPCGGRLVSNMSPIVAWDEKGATIAMGSPGASRITTTIFQGWLRFAFEKFAIEKMVSAPRLHVDKVHDEFTTQFEPGIDVSLIQNFFKTRPFDGPNMYFGALNIAGLDVSGKLHVQSDTRRHGASYIDN